jgi:hypothetical protein
MGIAKINFMRRWKRALIALSAVLVCVAALPLKAQGQSVRAVYQVAAEDYSSQPVYFNVKTHKYHKPTCIWAQRCTRNCVMIPRGEAINRGGVPCKVCGG